MKQLFLCLSIFVTISSIAGNQGKKFLKETDFVFIPSATYKLNDSANPVSIHAFYMLKTEVTNLQYREFLNDLKVQNRMEDYKKALPDTNAWNIKNAYMQPMVNFYFNHPAYDNYPVVNISFEAATMFCVWLTEKLKINFPDLKLNDVRIPTSAEWQYAASGGLQSVNYSWGSNFLRNAKGECMGNFCQVGDERITKNENKFEVVDNFALGAGVAGSISDNSFITAPAQSYFPNSYGLYNMCGNVSELVYYNSLFDNFKINDTVAIGGNWNSPGYDVRISSWVTFEKANPFTGFRPVITYMGSFQ